MRAKKSISSSTRVAVLDMYVNQRLGSPTIARTLGCGETTVYRILRDADVVMDRDTRLTARAGVRRFEDEVEREITEKYKAGSSTDRLKVEYQCSNAAIRTAIRHSKAAMRKLGAQNVRAFTAIQVEEMKHLWQSGVSQSAIARMFNSSQHTISNVLKLHGVSVVTRISRGAGHPSWKGGRITVSSGYVSVIVPHDSPFAAMRNTGGYVQEHRLAMAKSLGRQLLKTETVHHINGDKADNRIENLQIRHGKHGKGQAFCCANCGSRNLIPVPLI